MAENTTGDSGVLGTVYLLHFVDKETGRSARYRHAAHYCGWALDPATRLHQHRSGGDKASPLIKAALGSGLDFVLARKWVQVDRHFERRLKDSGSMVRHCPICQSERIVCPVMQ